MFNIKMGSGLVVLLLVCCTTLVLAGSGTGDTSSYTANSQSVASTGGASISITMDSSADCQGYVICLSHDNTVVTLDSITTGGTAADAAGAEFAIANTYATNGTLGVVMDFTAPFDGQVIAAGSNVTVANFNYSCNNAVFYIEGDAAPATESAALTFEDDTNNNPPLENVTVSGGLSVYPDPMNDGTCDCEPVEIPAEDTELWMTTSFPEEAHAGESGELCFYYYDGDDYIQGMTMTACYDCALTVGTEWDWAGSIVEQVGVEYLAIQVDDDETDGDDCEVVVAILMDALPPFEGQTLPQTPQGPNDATTWDASMLIGCLPLTIDEDASCDSAHDISWCNGINGNGNVTLYNNVVIDFQSLQNYARNDTSVYVVPEEVFQRGDCNGDDKVDLADAATMLANQFSGLPVGCEDACDTNDDGILNMADPVAALNWLFKFGTEPPAPGPFNDGPDPTGDSLPECNSDDTSCT